MQLYEQEDKGLFTFYREQDEYEQYMKRRLNDLQTSKLQDLSNMKGEREKTNPIKKRKLQKQLTQAQLSHNTASKKLDENIETKDYERCHDTIPPVEKSRLNRNHKLLKMSLKKTESDEQNGQDLKNHLKELLKTEESILATLEQTRVEKAYSKPQKNSVGNRNILPQQLISNNLGLQANLKMKTEAKEIAQIIPSRPSKQPIHQLKNIVFSKSNQQVRKRFSQKFPRINKKVYSQKFRLLDKSDMTLQNIYSIQRTKYLSPTRIIEQYLEPICTERKKRTSYALNIEYFKPNRPSDNNQKGQTILGLLPNEWQGGKEEAIRDLAKNIKLK